MICTTIKEGAECPFMSAKGCSYNEGICHQIVEQCQGCNRGAEYSAGWYCSACPDPAAALTWDAMLQFPFFHFAEGSGQDAQYQPDENSAPRLQPWHCSTI